MTNLKPFWNKSGPRKVHLQLQILCLKRMKHKIHSRPSGSENDESIGVQAPNNDNSDTEIEDYPVEASF